MPTYEYLCDDCGKKFDAFQSIKAEPLKRCPSCGHNSLRRLISGGAGIIFKGSGFYITDYKHQNGESYKSTPKKAEATTSKETKPKVPKKTKQDSTSASKPKSDTKQNK